MSNSRTARALAFPGEVLVFPDLRRWCVRTVVFAVCLMSALFLTALRLEITRLHYDLSRLHRETQTLGAEVAQLEVEAAALASPKRIEEQARALGFIYPRPDQVVVLDE